MKGSRDAKKIYLMRYRVNEQEITRLEDEIEKWESTAEKVTACFDSIRGSRSDDRLQYAVDILCELRGALYDRLLDSVELRMSIERCIASVADNRYRIILEYRYIDGLTWEGIAELLNNEYRWIMRLHNRALDILSTPDA